MTLYVIANTDMPKYWSTESGWGSLASATRHTEEQYEHELLMRAERPKWESPSKYHPWVALGYIDSIVFASFIAGCEACGLFQDAALLDRVAREMGLGRQDLNDIIDRAKSECNGLVRVAANSQLEDSDLDDGDGGMESLDCEDNVPD